MTTFALQPVIYHLDVARFDITYISPSPDRRENIDICVRNSCEAREYNSNVR